MEKEKGVLDKGLREVFRINPGMKAKWLLLSILLGTALLYPRGYSSAAEENYVLYGVTKYFILYYNPKSVTSSSKDTVRFRIKVVSKCNDSKDWIVKTHPHCSNTDWNYVITVTEIHCARKQDRDIESVGYDPAGNPVESSDIETPWSDIAPESYTDFLYRLICN